MWVCHEQTTRDQNDAILMACQTIQPLIWGNQNHPKLKVVLGGLGLGWSMFNFRLDANQVKQITLN